MQVCCGAVVGRDQAGGEDWVCTYVVNVGMAQATFHQIYEGGEKLNFSFLSMKLEP